MSEGDVLLKRIFVRKKTVEFVNRFGSRHGIEFRQSLLCCFLWNLRACRHGDRPAATGQDDPGRWRPSSVMSTKPLLRIERIWLMIERHATPSLFFRGSRYPHPILGFG